MYSHHFLAVDAASSSGRVLPEQAKLLHTVTRSERVSGYFKVAYGCDVSFQQLVLPRRRASLALLTAEVQNVSRVGQTTTATTSTVPSGGTPGNNHT